MKIAVNNVESWKIVTNVFLFFMLLQSKNDNKKQDF